MTETPRYWKPQLVEGGLQLPGKEDRNKTSASSVEPFGHPGSHQLIETAEGCRLRQM
jgi:hypothetical protein